MDGNIGRALWIGIGVLFFIAVVSLGLSLLDQGRSIAQEQSTQLADVQKRLTDSDFDMYDNQQVVGSQVMSAIRSFKSEGATVAISVTTKRSSVIYLNAATFAADLVTLGTVQSATDVDNAIKNARNEAHTAYINPVAKFDARVKKDQNGVVSGIVFIQE